MVLVLFKLQFCTLLCKLWSKYSVAQINHAIDALLETRIKLTCMCVYYMYILCVLIFAGSFICYNNI